MSCKNDFCSYLPIKHCLHCLIVHSSGGVMIYFDRIEVVNILSQSAGNCFTKEILVEVNGSVECASLFHYVPVLLADFYVDILMYLGFNNISNRACEHLY